MPEAYRISGHTRLISLLGNPTSHSMSPATHNLSFELLGVDAVYLCFDVEPEDLGTIISALKAMDSWDGSNVTMPCKQEVIQYLDGLDDAAELMGAVNVVKYTDGKTVGYNTDGLGFVNNLRKHGVNPEGKRMVLLGPGGAGSAILVQSALEGASKIDVFARAGGKSYTQAQGLIERVVAKTGCEIELHDINDTDALAACINAADILTNATSVGMGDGCADTPVSPDLIKPGMVVADAIYHPRETQLIQDAKDKDCITVPGLGMMIEQAAAGEKIWYDVQMPIEEIERQLFSD